MDERCTLGEGNPDEGLGPALAAARRTSRFRVARATDGGWPPPTTRRALPGAPGGERADVARAVYGGHAPVQPSPRAGLP